MDQTATTRGLNKSYILITKKNKRHILKIPENSRKGALHYTIRVITVQRIGHKGEIKAAKIEIEGLNHAQIDTRVRKNGRTEMVQMENPFLA